MTMIKPSTLHHLPYKWPVCVMMNPYYRQSGQGKKKTTKNPNLPPWSIRRIAKIIPILPQQATSKSSDCSMVGKSNSASGKEDLSSGSKALNALKGSAQLICIMGGAKCSFLRPGELHTWIESMYRDNKSYRKWEWDSVTCNLHGSEAPVLQRLDHWEAPETFVAPGTGMHLTQTLIPIQGALLTLFNTQGAWAERALLPGSPFITQSYSEMRKGCLPLSDFPPVPYSGGRKAQVSLGRPDKLIPGLAAHDQQPESQNQDNHLVSGTDWPSCCLTCYLSNANEKLL